ncbi:unnamed protein product [Brassica rapa subsp. narinosa]
MPLLWLSGSEEFAQFSRTTTKVESLISTASNPGSLQLISSLEGHQI